MSDAEPSKEVLKQRVRDLEDDVKKDHEARITKNERYRLQMQGALKIISLILGAGGFSYLLTLL